QAKIADLGLQEGAVVAQVAPQCFDISLWQLVSALLVGGRTLLVEQEAVLDVERFVDTLVAGRVNVVQVVPSYLEALLSYLERHPRDLPDLHTVSATGEALKLELAQRFFAVQQRIAPGREIALVNAYGLTETSDDTNHAVLRRAPAGDRVPLGPAVQNVAVYVVDENLVPVPLGAPGLICFSGVCVGRGYVNDPERTAAVYLTDPHRPGTRLYKGGDYGRWLPTGELEFLGRRDSQVKIAGFRIEIGEIDNALLRVPGVDDAAVVVAERPDRGKYLVAFYASPREIGVDALRERLGATLPHYMVPTAFHRRDRLPLTANGKIDTKALTALAAELEVVDDAGEPPRTPTERRLAGAYAAVLGVPEAQVGRLDHFFDRGGSSLSAVKLAIALERAVSLRDVTRHPVLADLAALVDGRADGPAAAASATASAPVPPGELLQVLAGPELCRESHFQDTARPEGGFHDTRDTPVPALICFPYAGGNAVNFAAMARALRGRLAVYAVELPGHDLAPEDGGREPFAAVEQVVEQVVAEVVRHGLTDVMLWGHSAGTATAVATARALEARGVPVRRVFLAAQLLGDADRRRAAVAELSTLTDADIAARLAADGGYTALAELDAPRAAHVGAAYRHDCTAAHRWFLDRVLDPAGTPAGGVLDPAGKPAGGVLDPGPAPAVRLAAPVTVVVAADDPSTADAARRHAQWRVLADEVDLHELPDGGHYFLRTRPERAAEVVAHAVLAPSR
ncbi:MAG TPA: alpha/beta fold hydrolase, partial [Pseudonocardia sp.]